MANDKNEMVRCIDCRHGSYMQWFQNPVICYCKLFEEKTVAESKRICDNFQRRPKPIDREKDVEHHDHY